ncbi:LPS export ABC transporter permease LptF [Roseobacter denitrificans]|uniref:Membrane protein, putative n=1 Tax=Roseobacter denitrificans (strain ATCC 33942 / OCh 114) TaxID=375451 RepID=Q164G6_ROSDO|nr:LPS export ABC transporter permease LptF [Roseobacter denitrificans]ABG32627.1 membrane protein, putative [Roseobacter denitrificans OCh 114]AVL52065.1 LPS export ABC transporter permease LptF [Roseobacter denitrificans]SFF92949.1 lipopolysaccharide export system permease protein [Roseobacter denitrificans OCh 114]
MVRLDRYMLSQLLVLFGFFALVLVAILWINRGVSLFDELISDGQSALVFLEFTALGLPKLITTVLPIATFAAAVYVTNRMNNESELTVLQATGSGPVRLARPVLVFGLIVFLMASMLHHVLMPLAQQQLGHRQNEIAQNATSRLLTEGRFLHPSEGVTFYTQEIDDDGVLRDVFLSDRRSVEEGVIYTAAHAYLIRDDERTSLIMVDGLAQRLTTATDRLATANFRDFSFDISALVQNDVSQRLDPDKMTTFQLLTPWDELSRETGRSIGKITQSFHARIADPLFCIVAALIGFSTLMIGGFSRFGVWREVGVAFVLLVAIDGLRSTLQSPVRRDPELWPLLYLPTFISALLVIAMLWVAARPRGSFFGLLRRSG